VANFSISGKPFVLLGNECRTVERLAVFLLIETETIVRGVGGPLQIATVTLENGFQRVSESEIQTLINENQSRFAAFHRVLLDVLG
jgi:hypothetical protein